MTLLLVRYGSKIPLINPKPVGHVVLFTSRPCVVSQEGTVTRAAGPKFLCEYSESPVPTALPGET